MKRDHKKEEKVISASGATSSKSVGYDQLPYHAMARLAERFTLGEGKHGRHNWRKGLTDKAYVLRRAGHIIKHTLKYIAKLEGFIPDDGDDDAGAIMWGGALLAEAQEAMKSTDVGGEVIDVTSFDDEFRTFLGDPTWSKTKKYKKGDRITFKSKKKGRKHG